MSFWKQVFGLAVCLVFLCSSLEIGPFENEEQFIDFYESWVNLEDAVEFRRVEEKLSDMLMNKSVDPCDDFYEYACGNLGETFRFLKSKDQFQLLPQNAARQKVYRLFTDELHDSDSETTRKMKLIHEECVNNKIWDPLELGNFIRSVASWPLLDENWSSSDFDWQNVSRVLGQYELSSFFRGETEIRDGKLCFVLKMNFPVHDKFPSAGNLSDLGFGDVALSEDDARTLQEFYQEIRSKWLYIADWQSNETAYSVAELEFIIEKINFKKYFQTIFGLEEIPDNQTVIVETPRYLHPLSYLLERTETRTIANFMFVDLVTTLMRIWSNYQDHPNFCNIWLLDGFRPAALEAYMNKYDFKKPTADAVLSIFNRLKERMKLLKLPREKLNSVRLTIPSYDYFRDLVERSYANLEVNKSSFFEYQKYKVQQRTNIELKAEERTFGIRIYSESSQIKYRRDVSMLTPPLFHRFSNLSANYAGIGEELAKRLVEEVGLSKSANPLDGWFYKAITLESLRVTLKGFHKQYQDDNEKWVVLSDSAEHREFFLKYAQKQCGSQDAGHVSTIISKLDAFSEVYNCPVGSKMYPTNLI